MNNRLTVCTALPFWRQRGMVITMQHNSNTHTVVSKNIRGFALSTLAAVSMAAIFAPAQAQNYPITSSQKATAKQVSERGIPLSELSPNAPDTYTIKRGDTLWAISGMYLKSPWRWPELWGMNMAAIANPHLIYPGQVLYLEKKDGYARLSTSRPGIPDTVRLSPRTRDEGASDLALPTLQMHLIEPFLVEPLVVDEATLGNAPRVVATVDDRVLMVKGDRIYARSMKADTLWAVAGQPRNYRMFRDATPLKDPESGVVLGYEAHYLGKAELVRGDKIETVTDAKGEKITDYIPATLDITSIKEEVRAGDRLLPAPPPVFKNFVPHGPTQPVDARVVSLYGNNALAYAGQNQVVAINKGTLDGMAPGLVLSVWTKGQRIKDKTDPEKSMIKLPNEQNGMGMVFRTFDRVSYVLILEVRNGVKVGDQLTEPR
jgi:hypothetical protein